MEWLTVDEEYDSVQKERPERKEKWTSKRMTAKLRYTMPPNYQELTYSDSEAEDVPHTPTSRPGPPLKKAETSRRTSKCCG